MKKIFTFMLMLAFALFAGVSCTNDQTGDDPTPDPVVPVVTVTGAPEANLTHEAGEFTLNYAVENGSLDGVLDVTTEATWLTKGDVTETTVTFTYAPNTNAPGSAAREAAIVFAYEGAESVTVTVKQDASKDFKFDVEYVAVGPLSTTPIVHPVDLDMNWGFHVATESSMNEFYQTTDPQTYIDTWVADQQQRMGAYFWYYSFSATNKGCSDEYTIMVNRGADEKAYLFIAGAELTTEVDPEYGEVMVTGGKFTTAMHIYEIPFTAIPSLSVQGGLSHAVSSNAESHTLTVKVTNPVEGAVLKAELDEDLNWISANVVKVDDETFKVNLLFGENQYAVPNATDVTLRYGKEIVYSWGTYVESCTLEDTVVSIKQHKNDYVTVPTYNISVKESKFHKFVVDVTTSDDTVGYVVDAKLKENVSDVSQLLTYAQGKVSDYMRWGNRLESYKLTPYFGNATDHLIKLNVNHYKETDKAYYIFVYPVDLESGVVLAEPTYIEAVVDDSATPTLKWVVSDGMVWNEENSTYELTVNPGATVTLKYELTNPVAEGSVNTGSIDDDWNVIVDDKFEVDQTNCTVTFTVDEFDSASNYHQYNNLKLYYSSDDSGWIWSIQSESLKIFQQAPVVLTADAITSLLKGGFSYALADGTSQDVTN